MNAHCRDVVGPTPLACFAPGQQYLPTLAKSSNDRAACTAADVLTATQREYIVHTLIPAALEYWEAALSVRPVTGKLRIQNPMPDGACFAEGFAWCAYGARTFPQTVLAKAVRSSNWQPAVSHLHLPHHDSTQ